MSPIAFSEMLIAKPVERPKSNRLSIDIAGDDVAQVNNAARAVRFGLGCLGATTEAPDTPAETAESGGLEKMPGVTVRIHTHEVNRRPFPHNSEVFEAYFAVVPAAENEHGVDVHWIDPPESVQEAMSDVGTIGIVTDELFDLSTQGLVEKLGLHKVRVEFWEETRHDYFDGDEYECGFNILSVEEVA